MKKRHPRLVQKPEPQAIPRRRSRRASGDLILDIIEAHPPDVLYYYTVHSKSSGEILAIGHAPTWEEAEAQAAWSVKQLTGKDLEFPDNENRAAAG